MTGRILVVLAVSLAFLLIALFSIAEDNPQGIVLVLYGISSMFILMAVSLVVIELEIRNDKEIGVAALKKLKHLQDRIDILELKLGGHIDREEWMK